MLSGTTERNAATLSQMHTVPGPVGADAGTSVAPLIGSRHGLLFRLVLFNIGALALLGAAFGQGWAQLVFSSDSTGLTYVIAAVFAVGLVFSLMRGRKISCEIECARKDHSCDDTWSGDYLRGVIGRSAGARAIYASALRVQVGARIAPVRQFSSTLVMLGLIGTVVGFILALSGIGASMASDVSAVSNMISRLIAGMSVALYTTLEGAILSLWLTVNYQFLSAGAANLVSGLVMLGERNARV